MALFNIRPCFSSSRTRSLISTLASTAIPIVSTIPAIPAKVSVACMEAMVPNRKKTFASSAISAIQPARL